ncbi:hypothetical protein SD70_09195 [Gordoniibacillus kamchatkensis]|uniref:UPF0637 protein SD70_09195 n=1 Tax=Gordoniibacillus kamchatkensis TaxID=1590651 RepID=A0ABR5AJG9_9BACL|nr:DUF1054 domain-containing protein [Paenibacillus sp. VKM B-2647]KIL41186.1 hypothetical protein SD70_09195 [Paenibacillus sp. VKM B-2647]
MVQASTALAEAPFAGFAATDFETFRIDGLEPRMEAIRTRIQPKFRALAAELQDELSLLTGSEQFLHIARHARRKVNAPVDTWMAFAHDKRGYKQHPHFQIGLFDDRVFVWLAFIYELPDKKRIAERLLARTDDVLAAVRNGFALSFDHMRKDAVRAEELGRDGWIAAVERFRDVKKAELLIGRVIASDDPTAGDGKAFLALAKTTFSALAPIYRLARG